MPSTFTLKSTPIPFFLCPSAFYCQLPVLACSLLHSFQLNVELSTYEGNARMKYIYAGGNLSVAALCSVLADG